MARRNDILEAARSLLWEKGYEATSPRDILDLSRAGQGSFYHHFRSKQQLAAQVITELAEERIRIFEAAVSAPGDIRQRVRLYLKQRKNPLLGCRMGRLVWDSAIKDETLRRPIERYFRHVERRLTEELQRAAARREVRLLIPAERLALLIISVIQGSFTLSRALQSARTDDAAAALDQLLDLTILEK